MMTRALCLALLLLLLAGVAAVTQNAPPLPTDLAQRQLAADSDPNNWLLYGRNYQAWRYSPLTQITKQNVCNLQVVWSMDTGMHQGFEATPIVVDGVMYFSTPWNHVLAVNAATGKQYWRYAYPIPDDEHPVLCCDAVNRGVGVGAGKVVSVSLNAHIFALDAQTGKRLWDTEMAPAKEAYSATLAPQVIGDKAIVGISGGEYGIRGFIDAYDINTGKRLWRFYTIPGPGEPGNDTWEGDSWKTGGCPNWMTCTYDPALNMIYAGIGNTGPDIDGQIRQGANLYATCVVALDANTGKLRWYYQTVPHDVWDLDCTVCPVIDDITIDGQRRQVVMFAPKNGYFYVLDRTNGKPIYALQVAHQVSWGTVTPDGVPHPNTDKYPVMGKGTIVAPGASGGKEWVNVAYDPQRKRMFIPLIEEPFSHTVLREPFRAGEWYWGGTSVQVPRGYGHIAAVDVEQRRIAWDKRTEFPHICSMLCTASGLVITGTPDQRLLVLDADNGNELWTYRAKSGWHSGPVSFAVGGKQYLAFANGWGGPSQGPAAPALDSVPNLNTMYVFALPQ